MYPQLDTSGTPIDRISRHYAVAFSGRLVSAIRLRQVRTDRQACPKYAPKWTTVWEGNTSTCSTDYAPGQCSGASFGSSNLMDFTLP